jgi:hypothetical protein
MMCFLVCKFTSIQDPQLLSLALVTLDGHEHYLELKPGNDISRARIDRSSDFVRANVLVKMWRFDFAWAIEREIGRLTGEWLLARAAESMAKVEVAFDHATEFMLMERVLRRAGLWKRAAEWIVPVNVSAITGSTEGESAAEACYRSLAERCLRRHHGLADALALRAAFVSVTETSTCKARVVHSDAFHRLVALVDTWADEHNPSRFDSEAWVRRWLMQRVHALDGRRPLDLIEEPGGPEQLESLMQAIDAGVHS